MSTDPNKSYVLAVHNTLLGVFNYLVLNLPHGWSLKAGDSPYEVGSSIKLEGVRWVRDGTSTNYIYDGKNAFRLTIGVRENERNRTTPTNVRVHREGRVVINGHEGWILAGRIRRGFIKTRWFDYLYCAFFCERTKRELELILEGRCGENALKTLSDSICQLKCH